MASNNTVEKIGNSTSSQLTAAERKAAYAEYLREHFAKTRESIQLINPTKNETRTYSVFNRDILRTYLKNPAAYYKRLIELSRYLYTRSNPYRKLIHYNASMIDVNYKTIIPLIDPSKPVNKKKVLNDYYKVCKIFENANFQAEIQKMLVIAWREDTAFGCVYYDDTGLFILPLPFDQCKVSAVYSDGTLGFSMDMAYFDNRSEQLDFYGEPFYSMYRAYQSDKINGRWQPMPDEHCFCIKVNIDDPTIPLPSYMPLFNSVINLCDTEDLQATKEEASIYKLLAFEMDTTGSEEADSFAVDPDTAIAYFNRVLDSLPEYVDAILTPVKINPISFQDDQAKDINIIENATKTLFNSSGGAQILNSSSISTTIGWQGALTSDEQYATSLLRPQIENFLNRWLNCLIKTSCKIRLMPVTEYSKKTYKDQLKTDATYGLPLKIALNTLNGYSELETISMNYLEEDILGLSEKFRPLQSSNTQSGTDGVGAPEKDETELSDSGDTSRNR